MEQVEAPLFEARSFPAKRKPLSLMLFRLVRLPRPSVDHNLSGSSLGISFLPFDLAVRSLLLLGFSLSGLTWRGLTWRGLICRFGLPRRHRRFGAFWFSSSSRFTIRFRRCSLNGGNWIRASGRRRLNRRRRIFLGVHGLRISGLRVRRLRIRGLRVRRLRGRRRFRLGAGDPLNSRRLSSGLLHGGVRQQYPATETERERADNGSNAQKVIPRP